MAAARLRLVFEDRHILNKSQRLEGLKRTWLLLKPSQETISDLSSYILHCFNLYHSCPNGIILTMDGFVLPPFESASLLKDKDVIGVKRKGKLPEIIRVDDGENLIEDNDILEKQALLTNVPLLANEEFEKESGGYHSEREEQEEEREEEGNQSEDALYKEKSSDRNVVSKKRKAIRKLGSFKKKKKLCHLDLEVSEDGFHIDQNVNTGFHPGKSSDRKKKVPKVKSRDKEQKILGKEENDYDTSQPLPSPKIGDKKKKVLEVKNKSKKARTLGSMENDDDSAQPLCSPKRSSEIQENGMGCGASTEVPDGSKKVQSRSARRKKAKRQWLRQIIKAEKEELKKLESPKVDVNKCSKEHQQQNQSHEIEIAPDTDAVPVVIRPGHIRFEPLDEEREALQQTKVPVDSFHWNGITNKKKGQKWGKETSTSWRNECESSKNESSEPMSVEEAKPTNNLVDFDNLAPLSRLPKEGDLIAYRLVELSSTWTPELTSFRVGKTSWYDSKSNKILLTPLPEYPIILEKPNEEDTFAQPPDNSFYKEDGSLEVDFSSLVDVRMVKESNADPVNLIIDGTHNPPMSNGASSSAALPCGNGEHDGNPNPEKQESAWDEITAALDAKKAELIRENGWIKENSGKGAWSFRALRGSAIGPTMAMLRANNDI